MENTVIKEVKEIFACFVMPGHLNETLISLIPKRLGADFLAAFRSISLCNTVYKVLTKLIVKWMRHLLPNIISPLQMAFVPGKLGLDNMIIAQEILHTISGKRGQTGYMAIKLDLEKAYDRLEWHFVRDILQLYKFPEPLTKLILSCISTFSIFVLVNGGKLDSFLPSRGIRQGDPLSPYLFIMCMEMLGFLIDLKCEENLWDLVKASRNGLAFSHLFFVNVLVLFAKVDLKNCYNVKETLDTICKLSG